MATQPQQQFFDASVDWYKDAQERAVIGKVVLAITHRGGRRAKDGCAFEIRVAVGRGQSRLADDYDEIEAMRCSVGAEHDIHISRRREKDKDEAKQAFIWKIQSNSTAAIEDGYHLAVIFSNVPAAASKAQFEVTGFHDGKPVGTKIVLLAAAKGPFSPPQPVGGAKPDERLEAGWHQMSCREGNMEYEPTVLFNADDDVLYGIFRDNGQAWLCRSGYPFRDWVAVENGAMPEDAYKQCTSPGVFFDQKLWLVGGSQVDPNTRDNSIWCFDPKQPGWKPFAAKNPFSRRMGHALLVFEDAIWLMGGFGSSGKALNDIWTLDVASERWTRKSNPDPWPKRCRFAACRFEDTICLYGGMDDPSDNKFKQDMWTYRTDGGWQKAVEELALDVIPKSACLQGFKDHLYLIGVGTARHGGNTRSFFYRTGKIEGQWTALPSDALEGWEKEQLPAYRLLAWDRRCLVANALGPNQPNTKIRTYVPECFNPRPE